MLSKQPKPTNREALNPIIGKKSLAASLPMSPDMQTIKRRCAQTAHISLHQILLSKSADTKRTAHPNFGRICRHASNYSSLRFTAASIPVRFAFPRRFRFGEAVFRSGRAKSQAQKAPNMTFSCQTQRNLGISAPTHRPGADVKQSTNPESAQFRRILQPQTSPGPRKLSSRFPFCPVSRLQSARCHLQSSPDQRPAPL